MRAVIAVVFVTGCCVCASQVRADTADDDFYRQAVKPILAARCFACHGALKREAGLRLDALSAIRRGGDNGAAVVSGRGGESLLIERVTATEESKRMPAEGEPLTAEQITILNRWVDAGADGPDEPLPPDPRDHWSFHSPHRPAALIGPDVPPDGNPIDVLLALRHSELGLQPVPEAAKPILLRRVYLDLIGLPPTPAQLRDFLSDTAPNAYERIVDQLLASPQYGERWGRHWMDVWRYSDWDGYAAEVRESQPNIWRWRDWIVESLNTDKPYDEMIREMLAADEIAPEDTAAVRATGFLVRNWYRFNRNVWLDASVEHTAKAFLGITLNCARCHDHKYDPISQTEYYQFRAFFEPHEIRTDRAEFSDGVGDLVRTFDADVSRPTYVFARGNEAKPDAEHPLSPAVPGALGGDALSINPVPLAATVYYPGLRPFAQREALEQAATRLSKAETELAARNTELAEARKKWDESKATVAAAALPPVAQDKAATGEAAGQATTPNAVASGGTDEKQVALSSAAAKAEAASSLAAEEMLAASANLTAVRARIAADTAAFAVQPHDDAKQLAREAGRAERVANFEQARLNVTRLEQELATAKAGTDDEAKKKAAALPNKLAEAAKARDTAQAALGEAREEYSHFGPVHPSTSTGRRAALARWISSKANPLTARVAVNHMWMRHFGSPLVSTVFDLGLNGKPPTHPEVLDYLACELMDGGWRMKPVHRLIVTSAAYRRQSAATSESNQSRDPENAYLWRMNPRRMEAEIVRDSVLSAANSLDATMSGPDLDPATALTVARRSLYFRSSKEKKVTFLEIFDSPNVTDCYRRSESVIPQQALAMINSSLTRAQARKLAGALADELHTADAKESQSVFIRAAFERLLCRPPTDAERQACLEYLENQQARLADASLQVAFATGDENPIKPSDNSQQRARENLIHVLLNHNDFLTIR